MDDYEITLNAIAADPVMAHTILFGHRHNRETAPFHKEMIRAYHSDQPRVLFMGFRGSAKSTLAEETILIKALFKRHKNIIIVGENEARAKERLTSIKRELEQNEEIRALFGEQVGAIWTETKIEIANGTIIQAFGRGQSLRGAKHLDTRPDFAFCDDLEDADCVLTKESRKKVNDWFWQVLLPALDDPVATPVRLAATPLHEEALAVTLSKLPEWHCSTLPIEYVDPISGERQPAWPDKFSLSGIDALKKSYYDAGNSDLFMQEYMCKVVDETRRLFTRSMFVFKPDMVRTYEAVYAAYDPARTVKNTSATTGKVVCSWVGNRLIVWEAAGRLWKPDEIIADMFDVDSRYNPVAIGVEETGLHEFIMQPLRAAQITRGQPLPLRTLKPPKGKLDFIRSLQPYFVAKEVIFAGTEMDFDDLVGQLLNFGHASSNIDVPNALAYMLHMRPGKPMYEDFSYDHILENIPVARRPYYLLVNSDGRCTAVVGCQLVEGRLNILSDDIREGEPGACLADIVGEFEREATPSGFGLRLIAPAEHFRPLDTIGLRAAAARVPTEVTRGGDSRAGREAIRGYLGRKSRGLPSLSVATRATWCLRAFAGGYARQLQKDGRLGEDPIDNVYSVLMGAIEAFAGMGHHGDDDSELTFAYSRDGRRFISARA